MHIHDLSQHHNDKILPIHVQFLVFSSFFFFSLILILQEKCKKKEGLVVIERSNFSLQIQQSVMSRITVYNLNSRSCPPTLFHLSSSKEDNRIRTSILPQTISIPSMSNFTFSAIISTPDVFGEALSRTGVSALVECEDWKKRMDISLDVTPTFCVQNAPEYSLNCPQWAVVPLEDEDQSASFFCTFTIKNKDTWQCDESTWTGELIVVKVMYPSKLL